MSGQTGGSPSDEAPGLDTRRAHSARVYNYWLGGKENFAADREAATGLLSSGSSTGSNCSSRAWSSPSSGGPSRASTARLR